MAYESLAGGWEYAVRGGKPMNRDVISFDAGYMSAAMDDAKIASMVVQLKRLRDLDGVEFDTLVGTGMSGTVVLKTLADALGVNWLAVRKPNDGSHSSWPVVGNLGRKWLFVDDFVATGATFNRVMRTINDEIVHGSRLWDTDFVGMFEYQNMEFRTPQFIYNNARNLQMRDNIVKVSKNVVSGMRNSHPYY